MIDVNEIIALEQEIMDEALEEATKEIIAEGASTPEGRLKSKQHIIKTISKSAVQAVTSGAAKLMNLTNPNISNNLPSNVKFYANQIKSLIKKSAKVITSGSIAVQGTAVGKNLNGFKTPAGEDYIGERYSVQKDGTVIKKPQILPAEAIVPAGLKGKHFARVEKEFSTIQEARKYADSLVTDRASSDVSRAGIKIKGLDRSFPSVRAAKEFLYNQIAIVPGGKLVILGEEFTGSRVPAHGNQSRVVMEVRGFQKEVLDANGNNRNNVIQVSADVDNVLGSDHDGDTIHMNFRYPNPKNSRESKVNTYMDKVISHFQNINKYDQLTADLGSFVEEVNARVAAVSDPNAKRFSQNSPMGAAEFYEENVQGSSMIGSVAALNNGLAYLSRYNVGLGMTTGITINGDIKHEFYNDSSKKGKDSLAFQNAILLNIILDNANNQQATALGINPSTVASVAILNRLGFDVNALDKIFTSDAAKSYTKFKAKKSIGAKSEYSSMTAAEATLLDEGIAESVSEAREMLASAKESGLSINTDNLSDKNQVVHTLALLEATDTISKDVYAINKLVGQHKSSNIASSNAELKMESEEITKVLDGKSSISGEGLTELKNNAVIKSFRKRLDKTASIYQSNNITATLHAEGTLELISELTGRTDIAKKDGDEQSKILKEYFLGILTTHVPAFKKATKFIGLTMEHSPKLKAEPLFNKVLHAAESVMATSDNAFLSAVTLNAREQFGQNYDALSLGLNRNRINEYTTEQEVKAIKEGFAALPAELQKDFIILDFVLNEGGMTSNSVQPWFDTQTLINISKSIDSIHQNILNDQVIESEKATAESIIMGNPDIIPTVMFFNSDRTISDKNGNMSAARSDGKHRALRVVNNHQRKGIISNKPHFVKIIKSLGNGKFESKIFKYEPISSARFKELTRKHKSPKNLLNAAMKEGGYKSMGSPTNQGPKGKAEIRNYTALKRAAANNTSSLINSKKLKFSNTKQDGSGFNNRTEPFTFYEYIQDKGHRSSSVDGNPKLKEALQELYKKYKVNFTLAQEFDKTVIQTGKIKSLSNERLVDYANLFQRLDPSAISSSHRAVVMEMAHRASDEQKASRNGLEWTDKGDISWLHSWFGSNNIPGHRPEIQRLVRLMEQEYGKFMDENIKVQTEIDRLTKNLVREKMGDGVGVAGKIWGFTHWLKGGLKEEHNNTIYGNMYDRVDGEMKLKDRTSFLKTKPSKAEKEFYNFFKETTNKYGKISSEQLGERWKEGYIPHLQVGLKESMRQRGLFGLYDYMLQGTGDINHVRVKGTNPITGKSEIKPFHEWKYEFYAAKGINKKGKWYTSFNKDQFKATASLDVIRKRAEDLAKSGKHDDGKLISKSEQEIHGMMGTNLMSRFAKSRGVKAAMFGSGDLGRALSQYVNTTMFVYGNENFKGFRAMKPLLDGVIAYNKTKGNENAVRYLETVWKRGFYSFKESQSGLGRLADSAIHKLIKLTRIRYLSLGFAGGFGNLVVGKYNEYRSKGGRTVIAGEKRYWGERKKSWALIKGQLNPESFAYDLIQGNDTSGLSQILMSPYIGSEHYIQGAGLVGQFTKAEWDRIGKNGEVPSDLQDKVDLYVENVTRQHGYGYSKVDQVGIATYSWGKAMLQFKKWMPTSVAERFQQETIDRFGELRTGSNLESFKVGSDLTRKLMSGEMSIKDFRKFYKDLPKHKKEAVQTFFRGMQVVSALTALSMIFGESDDDEARAFAKWCDDSVDDIMFMTDPRRLKNAVEPASWSILKSGAVMVQGAATLDEDRFKGGLSGISWTASQVLSKSEKGVKKISE
jgi:hypothetical protein